MSESLDLEKQPCLYGADPNIWAIGSAAAEATIGWSKMWGEVGARAVGAGLDMWGGGYKPFADASRFLKAEAAQVPIDREPKNIIWEDDRAVLYEYETTAELEPGCEPKDVPLVTVFAWMNDGSILGKDLIPSLLHKGYKVYRPDWKQPQRGPDNPGLEEYILDTLPAALEQVKSASGSDEVSLLGWCQGGYGATILTALQEQVARQSGLSHGNGLGIRNLIQLTTPLSISPEEKSCGGFAKMANDPSFNPRQIVANNGGVMPGWMIDAAAKGLKPRENYIETHRKLWEHVQNGDTAKIESWEEWNSWTKLLRNVSGPLFVDIMERLYHKNELAEGTMELRGMPVNLANLRGVSVLTLIALRDHIVPVGQITDAMHLVGSKDHTVLKKPGGHISVVSPSTCEQMDEWLSLRSSRNRKLEAA